MLENQAFYSLAIFGFAPSKALVAQAACGFTGP